MTILRPIPEFRTTEQEQEQATQRKKTRLESSMESQKFQHMVLTWRLYKQADQFLQFARTEEGRNHPVVVAFMDAKAAFYSRSPGVQVDADDEQIDVVGYFVAGQRTQPQ